LALINQFDTLYTAGKTAEADAVLAHIDALLAGTVPVEGKPNTFASGKATQAIESAKAERASVVSRAQGDASLFSAKRQAFLSNPGVVLTGDWADAFTSFVNRDTVQVFILPPNASGIDLWLNRDPEIQKMQEQKAAMVRQIEINKKNFEELRKADLAPKAKEASN
jgi:hypothetical protein